MAKHLRSSLIITILVLVIMAFLSAPSAYAKTVKCKMYNIIKKGNVVYCDNGHYVFKVNIKTRKVTRLAKTLGGPKKLKGKYLYMFNFSGGATGTDICRINIKTKAKKILVKDVSYGAVAVCKKKIYYKKVVPKGYSYVLKKRVMKLNGKSKKATRVKAKTIIKETNAAGYSVWNSYDSEYEDWEDYEENSEDGMIDYYLSTPKDDIFLERYYPMVG